MLGEESKWAEENELRELDPANNPVLCSTPSIDSDIRGNMWKIATRFHPNGKNVSGRIALVLAVADDIKLKAPKSTATSSFDVVTSSPRPLPGRAQDSSLSASNSPRNELSQEDATTSATVLLPPLSDDEHLWIESFKVAMVRLCFSGSRVRCISNGNAASRRSYF